MTDADILRQRHAIRATFGAVLALPQPAIAAVHGFALGGGCELALSCDLVVADATATFGLPEVTVGLVPGGGGTQLALRRLGPGRAADLVLTGRRVGIDEAERLGTRRPAGARRPGPSPRPSSSPGRSPPTPRWRSGRPSGPSGMAGGSRWRPGSTSRTRPGGPPRFRPTGGRASPPSSRSAGRPGRASSRGLVWPLVTSAQAGDPHGGRLAERVPAGVVRRHREIGALGVHRDGRLEPAAPLGADLGQRRRRTSPRAPSSCRVRSPRSSSRRRSTRRPCSPAPPRRACPSGNRSSPR